MNLKDPKRVEVVRPNFLIYGPPKTAKTSLAATYPGRKLYLNFDMELATHFPRVFLGAELMEPDFTWRDVPALMEEVGKTVRDLDDPGFDVIIGDPIGDHYRQLLEARSNYHRRPAPEMYGDVNVDLERFWRSMCKSPKVACIMVAHDAPQKDEESGRMVRMPFAGPSKPTLGRKLMGMVDVIAYTEKVEGDDATEFVARFGRGGGDRFGGALGSSRVYARQLPDGSIDSEVRGLDEWVEVISKARPAEPAEQPAEPAKSKKE